MTGTERLRELAKDTCKIYLWGIIRAYREDKYDTVEGDGKTLNGLLCEIADQIELEDERGCDVETVRHDAYEAWEWVRKHGGLDAVRRRWGCLDYYADPVPRSCMEKRLARLQRQIDESHAALGRRRVRIEELGHRVGDLTRENAELRRRAMPDGMEWPTVDGRKVDFKTPYQPDLGVLEAVSIYNNGAVEVMSHDGIIKPVSEIHTAVLAADGEPLEVGQTVWDTNGDELQVLSIENDHERHVTCHYEGVDGIKANGWWLTRELTHKRPVLDADGAPIKKGDTVYLLTGEWCDEFPCLGFHGGEELEVFDDGEADHVPGGVQCREKEKGTGYRYTCYPQPSQLTHTKPAPPDSWERIEEDIAEGFMATEETARDLREEARDIVRRCRALAERERGE
ncbi:MAG TPA: hypothetical protein IAA15_02570 [Candidatus Olsenella pullicola]|nr:hypothetical protein [Candidatus Olsenella pullicola]